MGLDISDLYRLDGLDTPSSDYIPGGKWVVHQGNLVGRSMMVSHVYRGTLSLVHTVMACKDLVADVVAVVLIPVLVKKNSMT